jgi:serine/threonine protein kinase
MSRCSPTLIADEPVALSTTPPDIALADGPPFAPDPLPPTAQPKRPSTPLARGQRLGDYRLEALIGRGASASVWRVTDVRLHMPLAIKLFTSRGRAGRALLRGVMREARAASRVVSDYVIRVKDAGWLEAEGLGFIAMELCADYPDSEQIPDGEDPRLTVGHTLEQRLPDTVEACVRAVYQAALGVADAHREGVFHRDIKPANILIRPGSGRAQITDFGLTVAELGHRPGGSVRLSVAGPSRRVIQGTPDYMPPEAAHGLPSDLHASADRVLLTGLDVYGLGATLYALLAGRPAFVPRAEAEDPIKDLLEQVRESDPTPLEDHTNRVPVSEGLARVVGKAMSRDSSARYTSARALAEDLQAILDGRPTTLDGPHLLWRSRQYLHRNRLHVSAAASVVVMLAAVATTAVVSWELDERVETAEGQALQAESRTQDAKRRAAQWQSEATDSAAVAQTAQADHAAALEVVADTRSARDAARKQARTLAGERDAAQAIAEEETARALSADEAQAQALATAAAAEVARQESMTAAERATAERDQANVEAAQARVRVESAEKAAAEAKLIAAEATRRAGTEGALRRAAETHAADLQKRLKASRALLAAATAANEARVAAAPSPATSPSPVAAPPPTPSGVE